MSQAGPRDLSPSQKRPRVEEQEARPREEESPWVKVVKKPRKTAVGKGNVNLEALGAGAEAGPIEMYISNTSNTTEEDDIKKVLETTAAGIDITANFKVTKAECLTKDANPRTKCWKVTVPFKFKEFMENDELYPSGWRYRKFFAARNVRNNTGAPARGRRQEKGGQESQVITREAMDSGHCHEGGQGGHEEDRSAGGPGIDPGAGGSYCREHRCCGSCSCRRE